VKRYPVLSYVVLTYLITWIISLPLVFTANHLFGISVSYKLHYLTAYGPLISALIVIYVTKGIDGLKALLSKVFLWKVNLIWYLVALSPLFIYLALGNVNLNLLGQINFLPNLGFGALLFWIFNSGLGEEVGWRGFLLPQLQKKYSPIKSSFILSLFWIIWHIPAFFYLPTYMKLGLGILPFFIIGIASGSIIYTWIFNNTRGSVFMVVLFHGVFNFVTASKAGEGIVAAVISTLIIIGACILLLLKPVGLKSSWYTN